MSVKYVPYDRLRDLVAIWLRTTLVFFPNVKGNEMLPRLILNTFRPVVERLGTGIAVYLIATGATEELAAQLANALVAGCFFLAEIAIVRFSRKEAE